jgi:hypothetical protein
MDHVFECLAGYPAGAHTMGGNGVLVRKENPPMEPRRGKWPTVQTFLRHLFEEDEHRQYDRLLVWLAGLVRDLHDLHGRKKGIDDVHRAGLALFLLGPSGIGKTFLVNQIIAPICGGKTANPFSFLSDPNERFNGDLFGAPLLVCDDPRTGHGRVDRGAHGQKIKELLSGGDTRCHAKGRDAISLRVYWRLVYMLNEDEDGFRAFPSLIEGLPERILALRGGEKKWDGFQQIPRGELRGLLEKELPAFVHHLLVEYGRPTELCDGRFGCVPFIHPVIGQLAWDATPEAQLEKVILSFPEVQDSWVGTSLDLLNALDRSPVHRLALRDHATSPDKLGRMLSTLCKKSPAHFSKTPTRTRRGSIYTITPRAAGENCQTSVTSVTAYDKSLQDNGLSGDTWPGEQVSPQAVGDTQDLADQ